MKIPKLQLSEWQCGFLLEALDAFDFKDKKLYAKILQLNKDIELANVINKIERDVKAIMEGTNG